jgi:hypothetical protein
MEIIYNKKPSITTLRAAIRKAVDKGADSIFIVWGENVIAIEYHANRAQWHGTGWIGRNGGSDLANELNIRAAFDRQLGNPMQFLRDHLTVIHIK